MSRAPQTAAPLDGARWTLERTLEDLEATADFAKDLAAHLAPGTLLVLSGGLGAGKTTFTQTLGRALGVSGMISSPTFILSRIHRTERGGPDLVHVDAYRTNPEGLESLDLGATQADAVTVVEWGRGLVEAALLGPGGSWLDLELSTGSETDSGSAVPGAQAEIITDFSETETDVVGSRRRAVLRGYGPDWARPPQL